MKLLPRARTTDLATQDLKDEVLIYDLKTDEAFCLNSTSANVFNACDGSTTFGELKAKYKLTDEIIYLTLDGLQKNNLLAGEYISPFTGMNRREVLKRVGLASMVILPIISGLVAPTAVAAASVNCSSTPKPRGCQTGGIISTANPTCAASTDMQKSSTCDSFSNNRAACSSGHVAYAGDCMNASGGTIYSCVCT